MSVEASQSQEGGDGGGETIVRGQNFLVAPRYFPPNTLYHYIGPCHSVTQSHQKVLTHFNQTPTVNNILIRFY